VGEGFFMDCQTRIAYQVLPSTTVSIGIVFGASLNPGKALRSNAVRAKTTATAIASFRGR
jgi:hypothetical protein